jgi:hypothetical protein
MNGPSDEYRAEVWRSLESIPNITQDRERVVTREVEEELEGLLDTVYAHLRDDVGSSAVLQRNEVSEEDAHAVLAAIDAWASVASSAVAWVYAPQSPSPKRMAGWATSVGDRLRQLADVLRHALMVAARALRAVSWSIGVSFPWGVSVGLSWS